MFGLLFVGLISVFLFILFIFLCYVCYLLDFLLGASYALYNNNNVLL